MMVHGRHASRRGRQLSGSKLNTGHMITWNGNTDELLDDDHQPIVLDQAEIDAMHEIARDNFEESLVGKPG